MPTIDSLIQELLPPSVAREYYELDTIEERKALLDKEWEPIEDRQQFHNSIKKLTARKQRELALCLAKAHKLRIEINDLTLYYTEKSAPWKKEAAEKKAAADALKKNSHRRKNLSKARAVRQAGRVEDAIQAGDIEKILKAGQAASANAETNERATVVAAAQMFLSGGLIDQATFEAAINERWTSKKLMSSLKK